MISGEIWRPSQQPQGRSQGSGSPSSAALPAAGTRHRSCLSLHVGFVPGQPGELDRQAHHILPKEPGRHTLSVLHSLPPPPPPGPPLSTLLPNAAPCGLRCPHSPSSEHRGLPNCSHVICPVLGAMLRPFPQPDRGESSLARESKTSVSFFLTG